MLKKIGIETDKTEKDNLIEYINVQFTKGILIDNAYSCIQLVCDDNLVIPVITSLAYFKAKVTIDSVFNV